MTQQHQDKSESNSSSMMNQTGSPIRITDSPSPAGALDTTSSVESPKFKINSKALTSVTSPDTASDSNTNMVHNNSNSNNININSMSTMPSLADHHHHLIHGMNSNSQSSSSSSRRFSHLGHIIITGAAGMLGSSLAKKLAQEGARLILADVKACEDRLNNLVEELKVISGSVNNSCIAVCGKGSNLTAESLIPLKNSNLNNMNMNINVDHKFNHGDGPDGPINPNDISNINTDESTQSPCSTSKTHQANSMTITSTASASHLTTQFIPCTLDVRSQQEIEDNLIKNVIENPLYNIQSIYGLFNNAGVQGEIQPIYDTNLDDFEFTIQVNVLGAFKVLRSITKYMKDRGWKGAVVSTSSTAHPGVPNMIGYSMSKAAVNALTGSASKDLAPFGIRCNSISPGHLGGFMWDRKIELQAKLHTQYWPHGDPKMVGECMLKKVPMRRCGEPEEVANVTAFLLSEDSSFVTGENWRVAGGE